MGSSKITRSIPSQLLLPVVVLCALCCIASYLGPAWIGHSAGINRLRERAQSVALAVSYASDSIRNREDLQRFVNSLGSDHDISEIVAVGGRPLRVVASTRNAWVGQSIAALPKLRIGEDLTQAVLTESVHFAFHETTCEVDCTIPIHGGAGNSLLSGGAVMVHIDAERVLATSRTWSRSLGTALCLASLAVIAGGAWLVHRRVLEPLQAITRAIATDTNAPDGLKNELGLVAAAFNANRAAAGDANKRLAAALRDVSAFRDTLNQLSIISITDRRGRILEVNDHFCRISQYSREELIGQNHRIINSGVHTRSFWIDVWGTIAAGQPWRGEICNRAKDGSTYWVDSIIAPFFDEHGKVDRYLSVRTDITARKMMEQEVLNASDRASAASLAKSAFLANMSHEIRTPMTSILGYVELLGDPNLSVKERADHLSTIQRNGEHLLCIINDILDISKIEAGKMTAERITVDPRRLMLEVESLMAVSAIGKGITLTIEQTTPLPATIQSDPMRIRQILMNLVGNAIKFTELGSVTLRASLDRTDSSSPRLQFKIEDTGIGMSQEQIDRLFSAFQQADTSTTRKFGGTGLGLRICKSLAQILGGDVTVTSSPGTGSTFAVTIATGNLDGVAMREPAELRLSGFAAAPANLDLSGRLVGKRIFLAEDGPDNQRLISFHLRKAGADVTVFDNGRLAFDAIIDPATGRPRSPAPCDLLVTDMQMPELDGYTLAFMLRGAGFSLPIIALTAHAMDGDASRCIEAGCDAYASKPIDRETLIDICLRAVHMPDHTAT